MLEENEASEEVELPESSKAETPIKEVEIDEIHSFIWSKNLPYLIWIAVDRIRKRFIGFVIGDRSAKTGKILWNWMKTGGITDGLLGVATDHWKPYELFIPPELRIPSKARTYTVEGYNCLF